MRNQLINTLPLTIALALVVPEARAFQHYNHQAGQKSYWSPSHALRAVVIYRKPHGYGEAESVVKIVSVSGGLLAVRDYRSCGGGNGQTVVKGDWTPDGRFFIFSTESSGGHSPWHSPTYVYSHLRGKFFSLDGFVGAITTPEFRLMFPSSVRTRTLAAGDVTVDLCRIEQKLTVVSERITSD